MSQITIREVSVDEVKKGRNSYFKASVVYTDEKGENRTKPIMSFANPAVFAQVKDAKAGEKYVVKVVKDGEYYNWASLVKVEGDIVPTKPVAGGKVLGSTYETADERKVKQLYIIKQSSISNAIEFVKYSQRDGVEPYTVGDILDIAQEFVDFVYSTDEAVEAVDRGNEGISEE